jgi:hypothetical protein
VADGIIKRLSKKVFHLHQWDYLEVEHNLLAYPWQRHGRPITFVKVRCKACGFLTTLQFDGDHYSLGDFRGEDEPHDS